MAAAPLPKSLAVSALLAVGVLAAQPTAAWASQSVADRSPGSAPVTELQRPQLGPALAALDGAVPYAVKPAKTLRLDPLAASSADPLSNAVALQPDSPGAGPISTSAVTGSLSQGGGLSSLPLVGGLSQVLPG